uniref:Putative secreted protein ovary overexpressed n=1 Tax=Rhipicephalus microplus TaxID=6941 RepID=A0A6M2D9U6_RHIMP
MLIFALLVLTIHFSLPAWIGPHKFAFRHRNVSHWVLCQRCGRALTPRPQPNSHFVSTWARNKVKETGTEAKETNKELLAHFIITCFPFPIEKMASEFFSFATPQTRPLRFILFVSNNIIISTTARIFTGMHIWCSKHKTLSNRMAGCGIMCPEVLILDTRYTKPYYSRPLV